MASEIETHEHDAAPPPALRDGSGRRSPRAPLGLDRFSGLYLWALVIVIFAIWVPRLFLTMGTLHSIASEQAIVAIAALAVMVPLSAGVYDLSVGATTNLSTIVAAVLQSDHGWNVAPAIGLAIAACILIGVVNGLVVVRLRVNSFIATLGMSSIVAAIQVIVSGSGQPNPPTSTVWTDLTQVKVLGFQAVVLYLIVVALILWWALSHTPAGRYIYAIGGNSEAARLSGVDVNRWTWLSLVTSASLAGIAGILYGSLAGPSLTFGAGLLLPAFAAAFLGSTQLSPGRFNVWGTLIAVYVLATGIKGLQLVTSAQWLGDMFYGVALILAVALAISRQRRSGARQRNLA